jgi:hypothetical protein
MIILENPCFGPRFDPDADKCEVLDELKALVFYSTVSIALTATPVSANRKLHRVLRGNTACREARAKAARIERIDPRMRGR